MLQIPNLKDQVLGEVQEPQLLVAQEPIADVADVVAASQREAGVGVRWLLPSFPEPLAQVELPQEAMHFPISELCQHVVRHVTGLKPVGCSEVLTPASRI